MQAIIFSLVALAFILLGGLFAIKFKSKIRAIMAFAAGVVLAVVFLDIFPELIEQVTEFSFEPVHVMLVVVGGFLLLHILEKTVLIHHAHECDYAKHCHPQVGVISSLALIGHSLLDGIAIGLGFQAGVGVGVLVAVAVIAHSFADGINDATVMLSNGNSDSRAKKVLVLHSLAPVVGAVLTLFFAASPAFITYYLAFFAGFLLYIGAGDILPEAHNGKSSYRLIGLTLLGVAFIFIITRLGHI